MVVLAARLEIAVQNQISVPEVMNVQTIAKMFVKTAMS